MSYINELKRVCGNVDLYNQIAVASGPMQQITESILVTPFWTPGFCELIINAADEHNDYKSLDADTQTYGAAPGQESRVDQFCSELFEAYKQHIMTWLSTPLSSFYRCPYLFNRPWDVFRVPFLVKYTMDSQRSMDEHHDTSLLSMSVKLTDPKKFQGTDLVFPRQQWSNIDVPQGHAVWFPGQLTHPHYANQLQSGTRHGMTGWIRGSDLRNVSP